LKDRKHYDGFLSALFILLYGIFRFFIEFFREPDIQLGFVLGPLSMGQVLCSFMIAIGILLMIYLRRKAKPGGSAQGEA
jgi:phosphatidylglycerol:prolipoprotein diacylglycerol transferase